MKKLDLKALYIKRMSEAMQRHKMSKHQALNKLYKPLIREVTPLHKNSMDAALHVAMVSSELEADGYGKKGK